MVKRRQSFSHSILVTAIMAVFLLSWPIGPSRAEMGELETFIRARIEIGETMVKYMQQLGQMDRSRENLRGMEKEINAMVAGVLKNYDLTIEEYEERSPKIFADEAAVNKFLDAHPDLKERYHALPMYHERRRGPS